MAVNAIEALGFLMRAQPAITSVVATYTGTAFPLIVHGVLPENQTGLPAINYYAGTYSNPFGAASDQTFIINCYAANATDSRSLATLVYNLFNSAIGDGDGYPIQTFASMVQSIPEQDGSVVNTPVQVRVISIRA